MNRKKFIQSIALTGLSIGTAMKLDALSRLSQRFENTDEMPLLFIGHGSPMNAIEDNIFTREMKAIGNE